MDGNVYSLNEYFPTRVDRKKMLVTTRHGKWVVLDDDEYELLAHNKVLESRPLFDRLESKGIVLTEKSVKTVISDFSEMYRCVVPRSMLCIVNVTDRCPMNCSYCFVSSNDLNSSAGKDLDEDVASDILKFICKMPMDSVGIEFQGGEPLVRFDLIRKFHDDLKKNFPKHGKRLDPFVIVSNLVMMDDDIAGFIMDNNIGLCSSLDGPKELHDRQRSYFDGSGSYDDVVRWHDYFRGRGKNVNLLPTITGLSLKYGARSIIDEYLMRGCNTVNFRPVYMGAKAKSNASLHLAPEKYADFWIDGVEYMAELTRKGTLVYDEFSRGLIRNMLGQVRGFMCARRPCGAGVSQLSFGVDGGIYACDMSKNVDEFRLGDARDSSYSDVYLNSLSFLSNTSEFQPLCDTCVYSAFCPSCASRVFSRRGDLCAFTPRDFDCIVYKKMFDYLFSKMQDKDYRRVFEKWAVARR